MPRLLTLKAEILLGLFLIKVLTVMEAMNTSLPDSLHDAWAVKFPQDISPATFSVPVENLLKTSPDDETLVSKGLVPNKKYTCGEDYVNFPDPEDSTLLIRFHINYFMGPFLVEIVYNWMRFAFQANTVFHYKHCIVVIVLIRAVTIHIYLASHLLIIIPLITEKMRFVAIIWLAIAGFRSILVNLVATAIGLFICSSLPEFHTSCFKFAGVKGLEIGSATFMWIIVNSYLQKIGRSTSRIDMLEDAYVQRVAEPATQFWAFPDLNRRRRFRRNQSEDSDSGDSLISLITDTITAVNRKQVDGLGLSPQERTEKIATSAVHMFFENTFGLKFEEDKADLKDDYTRKFMDTHHVEVERFIIKIENYINEKRLKAKCLHTNCLYCKRNTWEQKSPKSEKERIPNYGMRYSYENLSPRVRELKEIKRAEEILIREISLIENRSSGRTELGFSSGYINLQRPFRQNISSEGSFDQGNNSSKCYRSNNKLAQNKSELYKPLIKMTTNTQVYSSHESRNFCNDDSIIGPSCSINQKAIPLNPHSIDHITNEVSKDGSGESIETKIIDKNLNIQTFSVDANPDFNPNFTVRKNSSVQTKKISKRLLKKIKEQEKKHGNQF